MKISDMITALEELEERHGDLEVETENGIAIHAVDVVLSEDNHGAAPVAVYVK